MLLSLQQRFILELIKKLGCLRRDQLLKLLKGKFDSDSYELEPRHMELMLRQLKIHNNTIRFSGELIHLENTRADTLLLEAVDIMIEISKGRVQEMAVGRRPELLVFSLKDSPSALFSVRLWSEMDSTRNHDGLNIIWLNNIGISPREFKLLPNHYYAERLSSGLHRFYGKEIN